MRSLWGWESEEIQLKMSIVIPGSVHLVSLVSHASLLVVMVVPPLDSFCFNYQLQGFRRIQVLLLMVLFKGLLVGFFSYIALLLNYRNCLL